MKTKRKTYGRVTCPVCERLITVSKGKTLHRHNNRTGRGPWRDNKPFCRGSGMTVIISDDVTYD